MRRAGLIKIWDERDRRYTLSTRTPLTPEQVEIVRVYRAREAADEGLLDLVDMAWTWEPPVKYQ